MKKFNDCCFRLVGLTPASPRRKYKFCPVCGTSLILTCVLCGKDMYLQDVNIIPLSYNSLKLYAHGECIAQALQRLQQ